MAMDGSYSSFNNNLLAQDRYQKFVKDAESKKELFENIQSKYEEYKNKYNWNLISYIGDGVQNGNWLDADRFAKSKIKNDVPSVNEAAFESKALDVTSVNTICGQYQELINSIGAISSDLEYLKEKIGKEKLSVDNKNYEIRIEEIITNIDNTYRKIMQEFIDAVKDRSSFLHDFQMCVAKDYCRYFGYRETYCVKKHWNREKDGWYL